MPTTYTDLLRLAKQATGENNNTWGTIANENVFELLEDAISGVLELNLTAGNVTLTTNNGTTDQARYAVIKCIGSPVANRTVTIPTVNKVYFVHNALTSDYTVTFTTGSGNTLTLAQDKVGYFYCDGTTIYEIPFLDASNNLSDLGSASAARTNLGLGDFATKTVGTGFTDVSGTISVTPVDSIPVGATLEWLTNTPPPKWLILNGDAVSRTTYSDLFALWGTQFGAGDGSTTFNLLDARGYFFRGLDNGAGVDPNAGARTDRGDGTTGDNVGTKQEDEFASHTHIRYGSLNDTSPGAGGSETIQNSNLSGSHNTLTSPTGGDETRPKNIAVNFIVYTGV